MVPQSTDFWGSSRNGVIIVGHTPSGRLLFLLPPPPAVLGEVDMPRCKSKLSRPQRKMFIITSDDPRSMRMRTVVQFYFCFRFIGVTSELHLLCVCPCCDHCTAVGELVELLHVGLDGFACLEGICSRIRLFWHAQRVLASVGWGRLMHIEV